MTHQVLPISWYIFRDGQQYGPLPDEQLRALAAQGQIQQTDLIWRDGWGDWQPPSAVFSVGAPAAPPLPSAGRPLRASDRARIEAPARAADSRRRSFLGVKVAGAVGVAAIAAAIGFYADIVSKVHGAACRVLPMAGVSAERLNCPADGEQVARVEKGVTRVERKVEAVQETVKSSEVQAKVIAKDVDALRKANDPSAIARQRIENARLTLDDAGYIKAVAQGSEVAGLYQELRIYGDEVTLRDALLRYNYRSPEFSNLMVYLAKAPTDHYAAKVRTDVRGLFDGMQRSKSANAVHAMACASTDNSFLVRFAKLNLADTCPDNARFLERVVELGLAAVAHFEEPQSVMFWSSQRSCAPNPRYCGASFGGVLTLGGAKGRK